MLVATAPYVRFAAITTSDTVNLPGGLTDAINVGVAGIVVVISEGDVATSLTLPVGIHPLRVKRINATTTTATTMAALYRQ